MSEFSTFLDGVILAFGDQPSKKDAAGTEGVENVQDIGIKESFNIDAVAVCHPTRVKNVFDGFLLPGSIGGKKRSWLYRDREKTDVKRGVCLRIQHVIENNGMVSGRTRYLLDFEPKDGPKDKPIQNSVVIVWNEGEGDIDDEEIFFEELIEAFARNNSTTGDRNKLPTGDYEIRLQDHLNKEKLKEAVAREHLKNLIFNAPGK